MSFEHLIRYLEYYEPKNKKISEDYKILQNETLSSDKFTNLDYLEYLNEDFLYLHFRDALKLHHS